MQDVESNENSFDKTSCNSDSLDKTYTKLFFQRELSNEELRAYRLNQKFVKFFQEGCLIRSCITGLGGGVIGSVFSSFLFAIKPVDIDTTLPFIKQLQQSYKGFGTEVKKSAKGFAKISFLYSLIDCTMAKKRAKQDTTNAFIAGCGAGAILAIKSQPTAIIGGCLGFGGLSALMEIWTNHKT